MVTPGLRSHLRRRHLAQLNKEELKMNFFITCVGGILLHFGPLPTAMWTSAVNIRSPNVPPFHRTFVSRGILPEGKSYQRRIRKKVCLEAPRGAVVPSVFPSMGNWASIWTSGNRGAQAPKPDPITEPETTQPSIGTRQTSRRQGKPQAELLRMTTTITKLGILR